MQENVILDIPESSENGWQPPVLKKEEIPEDPQSCADIFFMQYIICILLLTALFSIRIYDEKIFQNTIAIFQQRTHADSESWILHLIALVQSLWN